MEGKVVAITGASSGIGKAIATLIAALGAYVVFGARRTDLMKELTSFIHAGGGKAVYMQAVVTRRGTRKCLIAVCKVLNVECKTGNRENTKLKLSKS